MKNWIKAKLGITFLEKECIRLKEDNRITNKILNAEKEKIKTLEKEFNKLHRIEADISYRDDSFIVLSGKIKGKDYVNIYRVPNDEIIKLNLYLKETFRKTRVDAPIGFNL